MFASNDVIHRATDVDLAFNFDGLYYGFALSILLFGITLVQLWIYIRNNTDCRALHFLVTVLILLNVASVCLDCQLLQHYVRVSKVANLVAVQQLTISFNVEVLIKMIVVFLVELYFAVQLYLFNKHRWWFSGLIVFFACGSFVVGVFTISTQLIDNSITKWGLKGRQIEVGLCQALIVASDATITVSSCWTFFSAQSEIEELRSSNTMTVLRKLLVYNLSRGLLVTIVQMLSLIIFLVYPTRMYWLPLHMCLGNLYIITTLAMLNSRTSLRSRLHNDPVINTLSLHSRLDCTA